MPRMVRWSCWWFLVLGWQKSSEITDVIVGLARFSTVFRPFFGCCVTVEVEVWSRAELLSSAAGGCCTERLRAQFSSPMRRAAESQLSCDSCVYHNSQQVYWSSRQVFELTIRFVLYSVFSTTTCESFDLYNTTTKFNFDFVFEGKTEFLLFLERHNRLKSDGKISEISQNEQEIWLRIFFKT